MIPSRAATRLTGARRSLEAASCARRDLGSEPSRDVPSSAVTSSAAGDRLEDGVELHGEKLRERNHLAEDLVLEDQLRDRVEDDGDHAAIGRDGRDASVKSVPEKVRPDRDHRSRAEADRPDHPRDGG